MTQQLLHAAIVPVLFGLIGGCAAVTGLGGEAAPQTYDLLASKPAPLAKSRQTRFQLVVSEPAAVRALTTDRILVKSGPESISYYGKAQWSDRLPSLLQTRLIESLSRSRRFAAVGGGSDRIEADVRMATNIRAFQIEMNGASAQAHISLYVKIFNEKSGRIVASRNFETSVAAPKDNVQAGVAALNSGLQTVLGQITSWSSKVQIETSVETRPERRAPAGAISKAPTRRG